MIRFSSPALSLTLSDYIKLAESWERCSACVGFCIALGERLFTTGLMDVDNTILPYLNGRTPKRDGAHICKRREHLIPIRYYIGSHNRCSEN